MSSLDFEYHKSTATTRTYPEYNFEIGVTRIGGLPTWIYVNTAGDKGYTGTMNMPAKSLCILEFTPDRLMNDVSTTTSQESTLSLYWGTVSRHGDTPYAISGSQKVEIDWKNGKATFPNSRTWVDKSGQLPWDTEASNGNLYKTLKRDSDGDDEHRNKRVEAIKAKTAWYTVDVANHDGELGGKGSMRFDLFIVKAVDGKTYLRVKTTPNGFSLHPLSVQQIVRFGLLWGDFSGNVGINVGNRPEQIMAEWNVNNALEEVKDLRIQLVDCEPDEAQKVLATVSKTKSSGWKIGGSLDDGGSGGGGEGGAEAGDVPVVA